MVYTVHTVHMYVCVMNVVYTVHTVPMYVCVMNVVYTVHKVHMYVCVMNVVYTAWFIITSDILSIRYHSYLGHLLLLSAILCTYVVLYSYTYTGVTVFPPPPTFCIIVIKLINRYFFHPHPQFYYSIFHQNLKLYY